MVREDKLDAQWLARLTEMGLLRASFVPPKAVRDLRDYTRARASFVLGRTLFEDKRRAREGLDLAQQARESFVSFGADRFKRDIAEVDAWLVTARAR